MYHRKNFVCDSLLYNRHNFFVTVVALPWDTTFKREEFVWLSHSVIDLTFKCSEITFKRLSVRSAFEWELFDSRLVYIHTLYNYVRMSRHSNVLLMTLECFIQMLFGEYLNIKKGVSIVWYVCLNVKHFCFIVMDCIRMFGNILSDILFFRSNIKSYIFVIMFEHLFECKSIFERSLYTFEHIDHN